MYHGFFRVLFYKYLLQHKTLLYFVSLLDNLLIRPSHAWRSQGKVRSLPRRIDCVFLSKFYFFQQLVFFFSDKINHLDEQVHSLIFDLFSHIKSILKANQWKYREKVILLQHSTLEPYFTQIHIIPRLSLEKQKEKCISHRVDRYSASTNDFTLPHFGQSNFLGMSNA